MNESNGAKEVACALKRVQSVLIFAHKNPDGDAIGSAVCAGLLLKSIGKTVDYAVRPDRGGCAALLEESKYFEKSLRDRYDAALVVDCSTPDYIDQNELLSRCERVILIDHHKTNAGYGDVCFIEPQSAATGELIFLLAREMGAVITEQMAHAVYISLVQDTGNFTYSNTTARTHRIAAELYGVCSDFYQISDKLRIFDKKRLGLIEAAVGSARFYSGGRLGVIALKKSDFDYGDMDTDGVIDYVRYARGCELAVFFKEGNDGEIKVSLRAGTDSLDVSDISRRFGGGGHEKAAGFVYRGSMQDLEQYFIDLAKELWTD